MATAPPAPMPVAAMRELGIAAIAAFALQFFHPSYRLIIPQDNRARYRVRLLL
jgi:hypothetical protein